MLSAALVAFAERPVPESSAPPPASERIAASRLERLERDFVTHADRLALRGRLAGAEALAAWLRPRLESLGADPATLAPRALRRQSRHGDADAAIREALRSFARATPEVDPADVPAILRERPAYPPNPAAEADLLRRLADAPAIATLRPRRAPDVARRLQGLDGERAAIEPRRREVERLREWIRSCLAGIPGEIGGAALVLADLEEVAALAQRGWPTAKAKRRVAESLGEIAETASPATLEFLRAAIDAMPEIPGRCVHRVESRGDGGLRIEFARSSIGEADRARWHERLSGRGERFRRPRLTPRRGIRSGRPKAPPKAASPPQAGRVPSAPADAAPGGRADPA